MKKVFMLFAVALITSSCASKWDVSALEKAPVTGSVFDKELKKEYANLAKIEKAEGDWDDVAYFVKKGWLSAKGETPRPEFANYRNIPKRFDEKVRFLRSKLINVIKNGANGFTPDMAAKAQTSYECWTQELEEGVQPKDIIFCEKEFYKNIKAIGLDKKTSIFFASGSARLMPEDKIKVKKIAQAFEDGQFDSLYVGGHTDAVGSKKANLVISQKRAQAVVTVLKKYGVKENQIRVFAYGQGAPAVCAMPGKPEPRNRRVEVYFE